jgi:HAD superfamily phosphoserine phosphatase-like hydrolase
MNKKASKFVNECLPKYIKESAMNKIRWHKNNNHKVVIVSACISNWIIEWCENNDILLIATTLELQGQKITGRLSSLNCSGENKVILINKHLDLQRFDYIYAYGDSNGDSEMLSLANEKYYRYFK